MKLKNKKLIAGLLLTAFTAATALTGCGGNDAQQNGGDAVAETITFTCANVMASGNNVTMGIEKFA